MPKESCHAPSKQIGAINIFDISKHLSWNIYVSTIHSTLQHGTACVKTVKAYPLEVTNDKANSELSLTTKEAKEDEAQHVAPLHRIARQCTTTKQTTASTSSRLTSAGKSRKWVFPSGTSCPHTSYTWGPDWYMDSALPTIWLDRNLEQPQGAPREQKCRQPNSKWPWYHLSGTLFSIAWWTDTTTATHTHAVPRTIFQRGRHAV